MKSSQNRKFRIISREVSDSDEPPTNCPKCGSEKYRREINLGDVFCNIVQAFCNIGQAFPKRVYSH